MIKRIIASIFGSKIELLKAQSSEIFNVFTKTVNELTEVNTEIQKEKDKRSEEIVKLKNECEELETTQKQNQSMINKISSFINS